ncbi:MAG: 16S rRNA (cytosine(967)-C(5))-methyltransferase RsmB [Candidatus Symbiodolus clandestinus]
MQQKVKLTTLNVRAVAAVILQQVLQQGRSLSPLLKTPPFKVADVDRSLLQAICYGALRILPRLEWLLQQLMSTSLLKKQPILHYLLLTGGYQLLEMPIPAYAVIHESVNATKQLKRPQLAGLINAVLRQWMRQQAVLQQRTDQPLAYQTCHPDWLVQWLQQAYPQQWQPIIQQNNQQPPLWLRVNQQCTTSRAYGEQLQTAGFKPIFHPTLDMAVGLPDSVAIKQLPGFAEGMVTVQDCSAQQCVPLLDPQAGELILDLCAAPGGKTTHILEWAPKAQVVAVDQDSIRLQRLVENVQRLQQTVTWIVGDALEPHTWWTGEQFDRILLDAPCSATGVIRRHPDSKWLRRPSDIATLAYKQQALLKAIWPYLKPGGLLLYTTCSILPEENQQQIKAFLAAERTASNLLVGMGGLLGWQVLPQAQGGDGFFYAKLIKRC